MRGLLNTQRSADTPEPHRPTMYVRAHADTSNRDNRSTCGNAPHHRLVVGWVD